MVLRLCRRLRLVLRCIDMPIASDGKGNFLTLDQNQQWVPARTATNQSGDTLVLDGGEWKPAPAGASTTGAQAQRYDPSGYPIAPAEAKKPAEFTLTDPSTWPVPQDPAAQRIRQAATDAFLNAPSQGERPGNMSVLTPEAQQAVNTTFGWSGRNVINPLATGLGYGIGALAAGGAAAGATVGELATAAGVPALGRDVNIAAQTVPATMDVTAASAVANRPRIEAPVPRSVSKTAVTPDALQLTDARQAVRNALMPTSDEIAPSSPTGISGPMQPPEGYVPPRPPTSAGATPPFTGTPATSAEAKQAASQLYKANAANAGKAMSPDFINALSDDLNAAGPKGPLETAIAGETPIGRMADEVQKLRDTPTTLEDAQRTYSRLGDAATEEFRKNGNSENYSQLMQIQANMRDRISPPDLAGDDPWTQARKAWSQAMKMQDLEQMKARADGTKNPQTSYQTQINNYVNNPARVRGWTDDEIQAAKDSATLGYIGNAIHLLGSRAIPVIAGTIEMRHGPVSSALAAGTTYTLGTGARAAENWLTTRRYNQALRLLGQGVPTNQLGP